MCNQFARQNFELKKLSTCKGSLLCSEKLVLTSQWGRSSKTGSTPYTTGASWTKTGFYNPCTATACLRITGFTITIAICFSKTGFTTCTAVKLCKTIAGFCFNKTGFYKVIFNWLYYGFLGLFNRFHNCKH